MAARRWLALETRRKALLHRAWSQDRRQAKAILKMRNPHQISLRETCHEFNPRTYVSRPARGPALRRFTRVAQSVEQRICSPSVEGSIPFTGFVDPDHTVANAPFGV